MGESLDGDMDRNHTYIISFASSMAHGYFFIRVWFNSVYLGPCEKSGEGHPRFCSRGNFESTWCATETQEYYFHERDVSTDPESQNATEGVIPSSGEKTETDGAKKDL